MAWQRGSLTVAAPVWSWPRLAGRARRGTWAILAPGGSWPREDRDPVAVLRGDRQRCDHRMDAGRPGLRSGPQLTSVCLWTAAGGGLCAVITLAWTRKRNRRQQHGPLEPPAGYVVGGDRDRAGLGS